MAKIVVLNKTERMYILSAKQYDSGTDVADKTVPFIFTLKLHKGFNKVEKSDLKKIDTNYLQKLVDVGAIEVGAVETSKPVQSVSKTLDAPKDASARRRGRPSTALNDKGDVQVVVGDNAPTVDPVSVVV